MLDPDAAAYLERLAVLPPPPEPLTPAAAREAYAASAKVTSGPGEPVEEVLDERLGGVPVRRYRPRGARGTTVYVHGGGWVVGDLDSHDALCRALAARSGGSVVAVAYDLAPEARHPAQVDQVRAVVAAVHAEGEPAVALAGDSAGGHLAALAAGAADVPVAGLALVYPVVSPALDTPSAHENATGYGLTTEAMRWYWRQYLPENGAAGPVTLLDAPLPDCPVLVLVAGHDPLRDEGLALAAALERAGRPVRVSAWDGQVHGFVRMAGVIAQAHEAQAEVAAFLDEVLHRRE